MKKNKNVSVAFLSFIENCMTMKSGVKFWSYMKYKITPHFVDT